MFLASKSDKKERKEQKSIIISLLRNNYNEHLVIFYYDL